MFHFISILLFALDLSPPFVKEWDNSIGRWHIFGDTYSSEENIYLVPKVQSTAGSIWTDAILPKTNWSAQFNISINHPDRYGGFTIWYIDEMSVLGPYFGGPASFAGVAVIGFIYQMTSGYFLDIHMIQSEDDHIDHLADTLPNPIGHFNLSDTTTEFCFKLEFFDKNVSFYVLNEEENLKLTTQEIKDVIEGNYLGITALNDEYTTSITLKNIVFQKAGENDEFEAKFNLLRSLSTLDEKRNYPFARKKANLRSAQFKQISLDSEICQRLEGNVTYFINTESKNVFDTISNCIEVAESLATYKSLNELVLSNFNNFSQKWAKRKTKLAQRTKEMNLTISQTFNQTEALINIFKNTIHETLVHSKKKAVHFQEVLEEINQTNFLDSEPSILFSPFIQFLIFTSASELICIFGLMIYSIFTEKKITR
ncbi:hypothetical protein TRFO_32555 [Tritrichomonas foetus]|uniref:L-type lectin-like domain-containing protein n=1 Tax=Tritrichomonas foetus TaxID=1144522 RepID=A0A1J4JNR1_9EUKA|nr:hypothetical protein TRFO_32555 [Tritrichomonas foetus]|eukprot:OHT00691.1 hypothetical protein TRFO_32555 [Tritrichomonas foetus]